MPRCVKCNDYHAGKCDPDHAKNHQDNLAVRRVVKELDSLEEEVADYLLTNEGQFALYCLRRLVPTPEGNNAHRAVPDGGSNGS